MSAFGNIPFDEIEIGRSVSVSRTIARTDVETLTFVSGDIDESQVKPAAGTESVPAAESVAAEAFFPYLLKRRLPGRLIKAREALPPVPCAVVYPLPAGSPGGDPARPDRAGAGGPRDANPGGSAGGGADLSLCTLVDAEDGRAVAGKAVAMVRAGAVQALMKGNLHTDKLMGTAVPAATGLRTRLASIAVMALVVDARARAGLTAGSR